MFEQFHLLRPYWLLALVPLAALVWQILKSKYAGGSWQTVVDPELLPHLLVSQGQTRRNRPIVPVTVV